MSPLIAITVEPSRVSSTKERSSRDVSTTSSPDRGGNGPVSPSTRLSFVIPVKDEEESIVELYCRIEREVEKEFPFEVIFIDDGSRDASWNVIRQLAGARPDRVHGLRFRRNAGKAAALSAGFQAARGEIVFTLDGDLQDDPQEIRRFLDKLGEGYDLVSGWKKVRHDPWHKVWPSRVFNRMISRLGGVTLHDHNCGFKCYRAEVAKSVAVYGELHRMIPSLAAMKGYRSTEIEVLHHPRQHGRSKYGVRRFLRGFFDMLTIYFLRHFSERPAHFCGGLGVVMFAVGLLFLTAAALGGAGSPLGLVAVGIGAAMTAATPLLWTLGLTAELLHRDGLERQRELPICEDTRSPSPSDHS